MGLARELIASGQVPPPEAFTVEGMFSEHDLPLSGDTSESILNLRGALGYAPDCTGEAAGWIQVGMSSNIDPENFHRPSMSIIACVDVSGSMGWSYAGINTEYPTPGSIARLLLTRLTGKFNDGDRVGIVTYGSNVTTLLEPIAGNHPRIQAAIEQLNTNGSTNMEAGLIRAFALARAEIASETDEVRVLLFTDIQPNVGSTSAGTFREMASHAAQENIGLSVFGLGVGMRQEVMNVISDLRGGNAYSLFQPGDVDELVDMNWPWLVVPLAHGLSLDLDLPAGITVDSAFGFPGFEEGNPGFNVASVFPSHRKGALLACLKPVSGSSLRGRSITGRLVYTPASGGSVSQDITWTFPSELSGIEERWFDQPAVGKTVALAVLVSGMKSAAEIYGESPTVAVAIMQDVTTRIVDDADASGDEGLIIEAQLATSLLVLMEEGAPQGDLYGQLYP